MSQATMRTFRLTLAYDGTNYSGWQVQPGRVTLQGTLEQTLAGITGQTIRVTASGRTDAGVHALGQVVSFRSTTTLTPQVLQKALNAELPSDMAVLDAAWVADDFHAIASATGKRYRYVLHDGPVRDVFTRQYAWTLHSRLDVDAMLRAAAALLGKHDFSSFETTGSQRQNSVRTVLDLTLVRGSHPAATHFSGVQDFVNLEIEADGFLYNMVRTIVGTLVEVGQHKRDIEWLSDVLVAQDRRAAGRTAPPQGLFLVRVDY